MNTNAPAPGAPEPRKTGPVAKTINYTIDTLYALMWGFLTVLGIVGAFIPATRWPGLGLAALCGWFTYRNIHNIVVHKGND